MTASLRRTTLLTLWLLLALLPLRGWANLTMHSPPAEAAATIAPCHGDPAAAADGDENTAQSCALCTLCHGAMLPAGQVRTAGEKPARDWPTSIAASVAAIEPDPLFRPPRS